MVCKMMKWTHLPMDGGLYDQHPKMLDNFLIIAGIEAKAERRRQEKQKREMELEQKKRKR